MIKQEEHEWGMRLRVKPFRGKHADLEIQADVHTAPERKQKQEIWFSYRGATRMRPADFRLGITAMTALLTEAIKVAESH